MERSQTSNRVIDKIEVHISFLHNSLPNFGEADILWVEISLHCREPSVQPVLAH
jgi:hypothetical protein